MTFDETNRQMKFPLKWIASIIEKGHVNDARLQFVQNEMEKKNVKIEWEKKTSIIWKRYKKTSNKQKNKIKMKKYIKSKSIIVSIFWSIFSIVNTKSYCAHFGKVEHAVNWVDAV